MNVCTREGNDTRRASQFALGMAILAAVISACAGHDQTVPPASRSIVADVIISVDNRSPRPKLIYLDAGRAEHSLGPVPARSSRSFSLPSAAGDSTADLRLEARDRRGGTLERSPAFRVSSGQRVRWELDQYGSGSVLTR